MCGRYTLSASHEALARAFLAEFAEELKASWKPRYNIAPGAGVVAVVADRDKGGRRAEILHWGLVPHWAKDPAIGYKMTNARAETVAAKPAYRDPFRYRRCLVPASGFYEWDRSRSPRQPWYFHPAGEDFMAMAAVWDHWLHPSGSEILSVALVTREAEAPVSRIHHRMPLILPSSAWSAWLDTLDSKPSMPEFLGMAVPADYMTGHRVSVEVNRGQAEGPSLVEPLEDAPCDDRHGLQQLDLF